jgi:tetratricopeptide (TPR) repeat protein
VTNDKLLKWAAGVVLAGVVATTGGGWLSSARGRRERDPVRLRERAEREVRAGQWAEAEGTLDQLWEVDRPTTADWMLRAELAMGRGRTAAALEALGRVGDDHALGPTARLQVGRLELARHHAREAEAAWLRAVELDPGQLEARRELIGLYDLQRRRADLDAQFRALAARTTLDFDQVLVWTRAEIGARKPGAGAADLEQFVKTDPADRRSRTALAEALVELGKRIEADAYLPPPPRDDAEAAALRARLALDRGDEETAEAMLTRGPAHHPGLCRQRGRLALRRRHGEAAAEQFRCVLKADPTDRDALDGLGEALRLLGRTEEAGPPARTAQAVEALGEMAARAGEPDERSRPDLPRRLGAACESAGLQTQARAWYVIAVERDYFDQEAHAGLRRLEAAGRQSSP